MLLGIVDCNFYDGLKLYKIFICLKNLEHMPSTIQVKSSVNNQKFLILFKRVLIRPQISACISLGCNLALQAFPTRKVGSVIFYKHIIKKNY